MTYLERCEPQREQIEKILIEEGISTDFYFLVLAESGCRNDVISSKGGAGMWQLMPETAKSFGLVINRKVDERYDLEKSTRAAARYLKQHMDFFHDFEWSIAAYNAGGTNLRRLVKWHKGMKFNEIKNIVYPSWALAKTVREIMRRDRDIKRKAATYLNALPAFVATPSRAPHPHQSLSSYTKLPFKNIIIGEKSGVFHSTETVLMMTE